MGREFIFTRDVPLGIMPIRSGRDNSLYAVRLHPEDADVAGWLPQFLHIGQFSHSSLDEALVEFVETAASYLAYSGVAHFELLPTLATTSFQYGRMSPLPPGLVLQLPGRYLQIIPRADRARADGKRWSAVPTERMWRVRLPRELGSPRTHRRLLRRVRRFGEVTPRFLLEANDLGQSVGYDVRAHKAASAMESERTTNKWGTIPSVWQVEGTTEYFLFSRRLQWQRAQALLREHLVRELNGLLRRLNVENELVVEGLPTSGEIADAMRSLQRGELTVEEAMSVGRL